MSRGAVLWLELEAEGRRPVCVLTRDEAIGALRNVVVALVTGRIRGLRSEVRLGPEDGMPRGCAISLDNVRTVPKALLSSRSQVSALSGSQSSAGHCGQPATAEPADAAFGSAAGDLLPQRAGVPDREHTGPFRREMAMKIGGEYRPDWLRRRHLDRMAAGAGLGEAAVRRRMRRLARIAGDQAAELLQHFRTRGVDRPVLERVAALVRDRARHLAEELR